MSEQDAFERWLSNRTQQTYIEDAGFTDQVMARLPEATHQNSYQGLIVAIATLFACLIAAWNVPVLGMVFDLLAKANVVSIYSIGLVGLVVGMAAVYYSARERLI